MNTAKIGALQMHRWLLLVAVLVAFGRLAWDLDAKNLWWDESLSLQRVEGNLGDLLLGRLIITDGLYSVVTTDQHPPGFFLLLAAFTRLIGQGEFALRFPALAAAVLIVPATWTLARQLTRRGLLPRATPGWAAFLAALNPFYLWYGQEARMYTLVALLALVSTDLLLRWSEQGGLRRLAAYGAALVGLLAVHYLAVLLLPVHAVLLYRRVARRGRRPALLVAGSLLSAGALMTGIAAVVILSQPGSGSNFRPISLGQLVPDLVNAFSLGLSVDLAQVWPLDVVFGLLLLVGMAWGLRSRRSLVAGGWVLPAFVVVPVSLLLAINQIQPAYMNARHLSLISGAFGLLVAGGLAWLWQRRRLLGGGMAGLLLAGMLYSTANYFTQPQYAKDDFAGLGAYLRAEMQPGDVLLLEPRDMLRLFRYYLPVDAIAATAGRADWLALPTLWGGWPETERQLERLHGQHRRIWLVTSLMFPYADPERRVEGWLAARSLHVREIGFRSPNSILELDLFLPRPPVSEGTPAVLPGELKAVFAGEVVLRGYRLEQPLWPGATTPVTLYWQAQLPIERRYKYILRLEAVADPAAGVLAITEREPFDGAIPTSFWRPGVTIAEPSDLPVPVQTAVMSGCCRLVLQMYDAETLQKLPLTAVTGAASSDDRLTLILSHLP